MSLNRREFLTAAAATAASVPTTSQCKPRGIDLDDIDIRLTRQRDDIFSYEIDYDGEHGDDPGLASHRAYGVAYDDISGDISIDQATAPVPTDRQYDVLSTTGLPDDLFDSAFIAIEVTTDRDEQVYGVFDTYDAQALDAGEQLDTDELNVESVEAAVHPHRY